NHFRTDDVFGDLNANAAEITAGPHDQHRFVRLELSDVHQQIPGGWNVPHHHGSLMKIERTRKLDCRAGRHRHHLGKSAPAFDAHHAGGTAVVLAVLGAWLERHDAGSRSPHARALILVPLSISTSFTSLLQPL